MSLLLSWILSVNESPATAVSCCEMSLAKIVTLLSLEHYDIELDR